MRFEPGDLLADDALANAGLTRDDGKLPLSTSLTNIRIAAI
jgi:hypothetical protein